MARITIDSILGGAAPSSHFAAKDQFFASIGIDPALPIDDTSTGITGSLSSGLLRPVSVINIYSSTAGSAASPPMWIRNNPKDGNIYAYNLNGSVCTINVLGQTVTFLNDGGSMSSASGNGSEYYDNYMYFAKNTDIARYGPLNGAAAFDGTYWTGTLGKAALTNTAYSNNNALQQIKYPNHPMHRHSDGKLYIGDVVGNQGAIHVISTSKTAVEGDTDNGSTASKLLFGYGLFPHDIETYGASLAIALNEMDSNTPTLISTTPRAKIAFWDTTSANFNTITWVEYPDTFISGMINVNGILYVFSGSPNWRGTRVTRFVGGYTFEEVLYLPNAVPPYPGALDGDSKRLLFGTLVQTPAVAAGVYSLSLENASLSKGLFCPFIATVNPASYSNAALVFSILTNRDYNFPFYNPIIGWGAGSVLSPFNSGIDVSYPSNSYGSVNPSVLSQIYKIGQPFEIKRIRIPLAQTLTANMSITVKLIFDDNIKTQTLATINSTNFPNLPETGFGRVANIKTAGDGTAIIRGQNNFQLQLTWTGTSLCVVGLPILIDLDIIPD